MRQTDTARTRQSVERLSPGAMKENSLSFSSSGYELAGSGPVPHGPLRTLFLRENRTAHAGECS